MSDTERYSDIIHLPHHQSEKRPHMSNYDRAAQFSPFAALKGYEEQIDEAARYTYGQAELDESQKSAINEKLVYLSRHEGVRVGVTYFRKDEHKEGGAFVTLKGTVKKVDEVNRKLVFEDGTIVRFHELIEIELL
ncbi:MAG: YolD-like family protein [Clostridia bacterium]|nr:YolD-like family protein [Clostridia bacterium]